jgi:2-polyprenyl-6-methoxyphenol hydroxylase-like FAD-dependent oxidoreductase
MSEGSPAPETLAVRCCIVGGGPAGMTLGLLLARAGVEVLVLEKHADFFRDFRGDTIHPSTLEVVHELGLLEDFLTRPHQELRLLRGWIGDEMIPVADFSRLPTRCKFIALMPQWDFLDFLTQHARKYPNFRLRMQAEVTGLIEEGGRVAGVRARTPAGALEVRADLVVGADGRHSTVREKAGLQTIDLGAPMDVLWMRLSQRAGDPKESMGRFDPGHVFVMIDRGDYWQCAFVIPKGGFDAVKRRGLDAFHAEVARLAPFLRDRVGEIADWDHVKLLTVAVNRVREWYRPGLLCIGDAAHAMSPIGGIGINLAVQDAVAAGNILAQPLRRGPAAVDRLRAVQRRRELPTRITQRAQVFIQSRVIGRVLTTQAKSFSMPLPLRLLRACPFLRRIPARLVGLGVQPEHVNKYLREAT